MGSIYTFWRTVNNDPKKAKQRYIWMFYNLMFKNLVSTISVLRDEPPQPVSNSKQQSLKKQGTSRYIIQSIKKF